MPYFSTKEGFSKVRVTFCTIVGLINCCKDYLIRVAVCGQTHYVDVFNVALYLIVGYTFTIEIPTVKV